MLDDIFNAPIPVRLIPVNPQTCPICHGHGTYLEEIYPLTYNWRAYWRPCPPPDDPAMPGCGGGGWYEVTEEII